MAETIKTRERFERSVQWSALEREVELRLLAGAVRSEIVDAGDHWIIESEWKILGHP